MNQILTVTLEIEKEGHKFLFSMPYGCPLGAAYSAAFEALQEIVQMSKAAADKAKPQEDIVEQA